MAFIDILDAEVINDEHEHDGAPAVSPEAGCKRALIISVVKETRC